MLWLSGLCEFPRLWRATWKAFFFYYFFFSLYKTRISTLCGPVTCGKNDGKFSQTSYRVWSYPEQNVISLDKLKECHLVKLIHLDFFFFFFNLSHIHVPVTFLPKRTRLIKSGCVIISITFTGMAYRTAVLSKQHGWNLALLPEKDPTVI